MLLKKNILFKYSTLILLALIVLLGFIIRLYDISNNPVGLFTDEAANGYVAYNLIKDGTDGYGNKFPLLFKPFGVFEKTYYLPFQYYIQIPSVMIFGLSEFSVRFTGIAIGTLTIVLCYLLTCRIFKNPTIGLMAALCLCVMPWHIHISRIGYVNYVSSVFMLTLFIYLFFLFIDSRKKYLFFTVGIIGIINYFTYRSAWINITVLSVIFFVVYNKILINSQKIIAILLILCLAILVFVLMKYDIYNFLFNDRVTDVWIGSNFIDQSNSLPLLIINNYIEYFSYSFLFDNGDDNWNKRIWLNDMGLMYPIYIPFVLLGLIRICFNFNKKLLILLILLVLYPVAGALSIDSPTNARTIIGTIVFSIFTGYGLYAFLLILHRFKKLYRYGLMILLMCATMYYVVDYLHEYHFNYPKYSEDFWGWQAGAKEIVEYFQSVEHKYDQMIMSHKFNGPGMLLRFYNKGDNDKYIIGGIEKLDIDLKQLFALSIDDYRDYQHTIKNNSDLNVLGTLYYLNNQPAFVFIESK